MADIFSYGYDTTAKTQLDSGNPTDPDPARSDVNASGSWTSNGKGWEITSEAACPLGTGLGLRQWRHDDNGVSGGNRMTMSSSVSELWFRFYMRYQLGFPWTGGGNPLYTKDIYGNQGGNFWIYGIQGSGCWGVSFSGNENHNGSGAFSWTDLMGGATGDGLWHCHEFHIRTGASGIVEVKIDNDLKFSESGSFTATMSDFIVGENQNDVAAPYTTSWYTDYDEIVVSDSGWVGPINAASYATPVSYVDF